LESFLRLGKGITEQTDLPESLAAAVLESIIGAIYLDGGLEPACSFVQRHFEPFIELAQHYQDYKSMFQQYAQSEHGTSPFYELLDEKGPDHAKAFEVVATFRVSGKAHTFSPAWGGSKKDAEQKAAKIALEKLGLLQEPPTPDTLDAD
jgi:ribonuclease-3